MKKIFTLAIIALAAAAATVSCSLMEQDVKVPQDNEVQFTTNIQEFNTKADVASATGFRNGDQIGIIAYEPINAMNVQYSVSGSSLTSENPIHWTVGQTESCEFAAYFPYDPKFSLIDNSYVLSVKEDQTSAENYRLSDFLVADVNGAPGKPVKLEFYHYFSRIDITLASELQGKVSAVSLAGVSTSVGVYNRQYGDPTTIKAGHISASEDGTTTEGWSLILIPQEATPTLVVTTNTGETLSYNIGKKMTFQNGKRYQASVSLGQGGSLKVEFVSRIFDWLNGDSVYFEQYQPRWCLSGPFTDHEYRYELTKRENGVFASERITFPEGAEFKLMLDYGSEGNIGVAEGVDNSLQAGQWVPAAENGYYFSVKDEGVYRVVLDVNQMRVRLEPGADWTVSRDYYTEESGWKNEMIAMEYQDGLTWKAAGVFMPPMSRFNFVDSNNPYYFKTWATAETAMYLSDGARAIAAEPGTYIVDTEGNGAYLYYEQGGFIDIVLDLAAGTIVFQRSADQVMTIDAILKGVPDGFDVTLTDVPVYARCTRGVIVSNDGKKGLLVYLGSNPASVPAIGDIITVAGKKQMYNGHPEINCTSCTVSSRTDKLAEVAYANLEDKWIESGDYPNACPIEISGQLTVALGSYETCYVSGNNRFKLYFPFDEYLKYSGSYITVKGWYTGEYDGVQNMIVDSVEGLEELRHGSGTLTDPYDVVGALLYIKSLGANVTSQDKVYIRGYVNSISTSFAPDKKAVFTIGDRGVSYEGSLTAYNVNFLQDKNWKFGNSQIYYRDEVILYGNVVFYKGKTPETADGQAYIYSLNGKTEEQAPDVILAGDGSMNNPYNVASAVMLAQSLRNQESSVSDYVFIKGVVKEIGNSYLKGYYANYTITDSGEQGGLFNLNVSEARYLGGGTWTEGQPDIAVGDSVIVCACLRSTAGTTANTFNGNNGDPWLYALNNVYKAFEVIIEPNETSLHVINQAYDFNIGVYSNVKFQVSCEADWLTVYNMGTYLWIQTTDNPSTEERTATIKLWYELGSIYKEAIVTIVQAGQDQPAPTVFEGYVIWSGRDFIHEWGQYNIDLGYYYQYPNVFCEKYQSWSTVPAGTTMRIYYVCDTRYDKHQILITTKDRNISTETCYAAGNLDTSKTQVELPLSEAFLSALVNENGLLLAGCGYDLYAVTLIEAQ